mmetsp:Transcript_6165/g.14232  ORF Transcript_6165/g.14232 Transcript_6165/m.14232 type:complete len:182 (+) Transcript_6165:174-719(+)
MKPSSTSKLENITRQQIESLFVMKQCEAAQKLGVSLSTLKNACRRLGFEKWPYARNRKLSDPEMPDDIEATTSCPSHSPAIMEHGREGGNHPGDHPRAPHRTQSSGADRTNSCRVLPNTAIGNSAYLQYQAAQSLAFALKFPSESDPFLGEPRLSTTRLLLTDEAHQNDFHAWLEWFIATD